MSGEDLRFDVHVHSDVTDGREDPRAVLASAGAAGLDGLVLTDHSTVTWSSVLLAEAAALELRLLCPGMEVSTHHNGVRIHVLLYGRPLLDDAVAEALSMPLRAKNARLDSVINLLHADGFTIDDRARLLTRSVHDDLPPRAMLSRTLITTELVRRHGIEQTEARARVEKHELSTRWGRSLDDDYLPTATVLEIARDADLAAAFAHPLWRCRSAKDVESTIRTLDSLLTPSLRGVETRSYHHRSLDDHPSLLGWASARGVALIGGSDYHANGRTQLGGETTSEVAFDRLLEGIAR